MPSARALSSHPFDPVPTSIPHTGHVNESLVVDSLMEIVAEPIRCDHEEHLVLAIVALVDAPAPGLHAVRLQLVASALDVGHENGGTVLARVATVYGETDSYTVAFRG